MTLDQFRETIVEFVKQRIRARKNGYTDSHFLSLEKAFNSLPNSSWMDRIIDAIEWNLVNNQPIDPVYNEIEEYYREKMVK